MDSMSQGHKLRFQKYVPSKPVSFSYIGVSVPDVAAAHHGTLLSFPRSEQATNVSKTLHK